MTFIIRITRDSARHVSGTRITRNEARRVSGTRITRNKARRVSGTVERVRTGEKERFTDTAGVGLVIERMLESDHQTKRRWRRIQEEEP